MWCLECYQLQGVGEKNTKMSAQLSASQCRLANLQRKNEQLAAAQKSQQISLGTQLDDLKLQFTKLQPDKKTKHTQVRDSPSLPPSFPFSLTHSLTHSLPPSLILPNSLTLQPEDSVCYEILGAVLNWLCRAHLSQPLSAVQLAVVQQESCKILPPLANLIARVPSLSTVNLQLPVVQFAYWCVAHVINDTSQVNKPFSSAGSFLTLSPSFRNPCYPPP